MTGLTMASAGQRRADDLAPHPPGSACSVKLSARTGPLFGDVKTKEIYSSKKVDFSREASWPHGGGVEAPCQPLSYSLWGWSLKRATRGGSRKSVGGSSGHASATCCPCGIKGSGRGHLP